jgi:hypothetical protein
MNGGGRGLVWLVVGLAVVLVVVAVGGAFMVIQERDRAESEKRLAEAARQRLAEEKRKTAEAERRAATTRSQGGGTAGAKGGLAAFRGRKAWVVTKSRPAKDYCAMLRRAGVTVRCAYATNRVNLHVLILRCPQLTAASGRALLSALGLNLRINNWQNENACGRYNEITLYLND